jgi:hypothetical protein
VKAIIVSPTACCIAAETAGRWPPIAPIAADSVPNRAWRPICPMDPRIGGDRNRSSVGTNLPTRLDDDALGQSQAVPPLGADRSGCDSHRGTSGADPAQSPLRNTSSPQLLATTTSPSTTPTKRVFGPTSTVGSSISRRKARQVHARLGRAGGPGGWATETLAPSLDQRGFRAVLESFEETRLG